MLFDYLYKAMKKVFEYLPLHFCVCVIVGIVFQFYTHLWQYGFFNLFLSLIFVLISLLLFKNRVIRTVVSFVLFLFIGISIVFINNDSNYNNYYLSHLSNNFSAVFKVSKVLKSNEYYNKYEVEVTQIDDLKTRGKILLNISKDSTLEPLKVDEIIYSKPEFYEIQKPLNPYQFDYKSYLKKQGIHKQVNLSYEQYKKIGYNSQSVSGMSSKFRRKIQIALKNYGFKTDEFAVINALLLGQRQELSKALQDKYVKAGAIHILAVSGLHIGIILWILTWVLKPIEKIKNGKLIKTICIVLLLWMFAFIADLSASVVRAVTMFTFLAFGLTFQRRNVILFSLISSMFFLLIFKPMFLFEVGFQLSYLAVLGIVLMQPKLDKLYHPRFFLDKKIWDILTVSMAAQLGVLPLSLYYFHQFPGLFMLSNLIVIPFLGAILFGGFLVIIGALLNILPKAIASFYESLIGFLNSFINWVAKQEHFLFNEISVSLMEMIAFYGVIIFGITLLYNKSVKALINFLASIIFIQGVFLYQRKKQIDKREFVIFHKSRNTVLGVRTGENLSVTHDLDSLSFSKLNSLGAYRISENIKSSLEKNPSNIYEFDGKTILVIDSLGVYQINDLKNVIVLLQQSPKINLERMIQTIAPIQIIADGSNFRSYVKRWGVTCNQQKTPFHYTGKNGAFILEKTIN